MFSFPGPNTVCAKGKKDRIWRPQLLSLTPKEVHAAWVTSLGIPSHPGREVKEERVVCVNSPAFSKSQVLGASLPHV